MKNRLKFMKFFIAAMMSCVFLFSLSSCGSKTKYLKGQACGSALEEGTAFSEMRKVYVERFVYEYNYGSVVISDDAAYHDCAEIFNYKYDFVDNSFVKYTDNTSDEYIQAHYLFTYYADNETAVQNYINNDLCASNSELASHYIQLIEGCAYGFTGSEQYGYYTKLNTKSEDGKYFAYDDDSPKVNGAAIQSVKQRLTANPKACIVFTDNFIDPDNKRYFISDFKENKKD